MLSDNRREYPRFSAAGDPIGRNERRLTVIDPVLRASDDDRRRVIATLQRHTTAGRLTLDEFSERVRGVYAATTFADLTMLTRDLPAEPLHRELLITLLLAAVTVAVLAIVFAVAK